MASPHRRTRRLPFSSSGVSSSETDLTLHLALAYLLIRVFPLNSEREPIRIYSTLFRSAILTIIAREAFEIPDIPTSFDSLRKEVDILVVPETDRVIHANEKVRSRGQKLPEERIEAESKESWMGVFVNGFESIPDGCAFLDNLEKELRDRISEDEEVDLAEIQEPIERSSPLGTFFRRTLLTLRKLSFDETSQLAEQVGQWCGVTSAGPSIPAHFRLRNRKMAMEDTLEKRIKAMQGYQAATASGDYSGALSSLRRFYDYQFPAAGRGQHQHALLNIATFHYATGGLASAQQAVEEAIRVARAEGDKACLRHCMSLLHRLNTETLSAAFEFSEEMRITTHPLPDSRIPKAASPMDELWSLQTALDLGEPAHIALRRIYLAIARYDTTHMKMQDKRDPTDGWTSRHPFDFGAWHAAQAALWTMMGSNKLAEIQEDLALKNADIRGDARLTILLAKADRMANQGNFDQALAVLLKYDTMQGMSLAAYHKWSNLIWSILRHQASLSETGQALDMIGSAQSGDTSQRGPGGPSHGHVLGDVDVGTVAAPGLRILQDEIRSSLRKAQKMQAAKTPPHLILPHVMPIIHLCDKLSLWPLKYTAVVCLAEILLLMDIDGMTKKAKEETESIWQEVLRLGHSEMIARAAFVLAKATIQASFDDNDAASATTLMDEAEAYLQQALESARKISWRTMLLESLTVAVLLSELRGDDALARRYREEWSEVDRGGLSNTKGMTEKIQKIRKLVETVGVRICATTI